MVIVFGEVSTQAKIDYDKVCTACTHMCIACTLVKFVSRWLGAHSKESVTTQPKRALIVGVNDVSFYYSG